MGNKRKGATPQRKRRKVVSPRVTSGSGEVMEALVADGAWQVTWGEEGIETARFYMDESKRTPAFIKELAGEAIHDLELWESVLVRAFLEQPESKSIRRLEIELRDFHRSTEPTARALASMTRPRLETLALALACPTWCLELTQKPKSSSGAEIHFHRGTGPLVSLETSRKLWRALPALRKLALAGGALFPGIEHEGLEVLWSRGEAVIGLGVPGDMYATGGEAGATQLPALRSLHLIYESDDWGGSLMADALEISPGVFPSLRRLDFRGSYIDLDGDKTLLQVAANWPILAQLETLVLPQIDNHEDGYDDQESLACIADRFKNLKSLIVGEATGSEAQCHSLFPKLVFEPQEIAEPFPVV